MNSCFLEALVLSVFNSVCRRCISWIGLIVLVGDVLGDVLDLVDEEGFDSFVSDLVDR